MSEWLAVLEVSVHHPSQQTRPPVPPVLVFSCCNQGTSERVMERTNQKYSQGMNGSKLQQCFSSSNRVLSVAVTVPVVVVVVAVLRIVVVFIL